MPDPVLEKETLVWRKVHNAALQNMLQRVALPCAGATLYQVLASLLQNVSTVDMRGQMQQLLSAVRTQVPPRYGLLRLVLQDNVCDALPQEVQPPVETMCPQVSPAMLQRSEAKTLDMLCQMRRKMQPQLRIKNQEVSCRQGLCEGQIPDELLQTMPGSMYQNSSANSPNTSPNIGVLRQMSLEVLGKVSLKEMRSTLPSDVFYANTHYTGSQWNKANTASTDMSMPSRQFNSVLEFVRQTWAEQEMRSDMLCMLQPNGTSHPKAVLHKGAQVPQG